jgi:hypothetical protein
MTSGGLPLPRSRARPPEPRQDSTNLADILERVLDKGIVIAGDIRVNLLDIELLTIKIRLLVASVDKAKEMGINWWEHDPTLTSHGGLAEENRLLRARVDELEAGSAAELDGGSPRAGEVEAPPDEADEPEEEPAEPRPRARRPERRPERTAERRSRRDG